MSLFITVPQGPLIAAVSGGVDSCVLLHLLAESGKKDIIVAHLNHNTRNKESDEDEAFVRQLSRSYGFEYVSEKLESKPEGEEAARDARYNFLRKIKDQYSAQYIALAHHQDDQVETLMLQLIRGTSSFSPLQEFRGDLWRPLLNFRKEDLISYAQEHQLDWREDVTNQSDIFARNRLRNSILPQLREVNSNFDEVFLRFAHNTFAQSSFIEKQANQWLESRKNHSRELFLELPLVVQKAIIKQLKPSLYAKHIDEVITLIEKGIGGKEKHGFSLKDKHIILL